MRSNNQFSAIEKAIIIDVNLAINDISGAKPILIVPFQGLQFDNNNLFNDIVMYDYNDIHHEYNHTGRFIASASSNNENAYRAFNYSTSGWESNSGGGQVPSQIYDVTTGRNGPVSNSFSAYGNVHFGHSFYNGKIYTPVKAPTVTRNDGTKTNFASKDIYGEWLQIQLPPDTPIYLYRYSIQVPAPTAAPATDFSSNIWPKDRITITKYINNEDNSDPYYLAQKKLQPPSTRLTSYFPKIFAVVGSNDGKNWYYLDQHSFIDPPDLSPNTKPRNVSGQGFVVDSSNNTIYFDINSIDHYSYFRLIITELFPGNTQAKVVQFSLYAFISNLTPNSGSLLQMSYGMPNLESFNNYSVFSSENSQENNLTKTNGLRKSNFSPQYVTGMDSNTTFSWDNFGKDPVSLQPTEFETSDNPKLMNEYNKQKSMINQAKVVTNVLSDLEPYSSFSESTNESKSVLGKGSRFCSVSGAPIENFDTNGFIENTSKDSTNVNNNQLLPMISIYNDYLSKQQHVNQNYFDMSQNLYDFKAEYKAMSTEPTDKYDFKATSFDKPPTHLDGLINDNKEIIMQQNSMYILSTITVATLVLALILVYK
jgi:hypothetical protein